MSDYKHVIVIRADLKLPKGKLAAQVGHAAVEAVLRSIKKDKDKVKEWRDNGSKKVVLKVADEKEMLKINQLAKDSGLVTAVITDAGRTVIAPGTRTCVGIGPDDEDKIDDICSELKMA